MLMRERGNTDHWAYCGATAAVRRRDECSDRFAGARLPAEHSGAAVVSCPEQRPPTPATEPHIEVPHMSHRLVIFGASGDLTSRKESREMLGGTSKLR